MKAAQALLFSFFICGGLAACSGENQTGHGDRVDEVVADSVVGGNATADTTTSSAELGADTSSAPE